MPYVPTPAPDITRRANSENLNVNISRKNHTGHGKNYIGHRKNYIRHNSNYIRPFFAACKPLKDRNIPKFYETGVTCCISGVCAFSAKHGNTPRKPALFMASHAKLLPKRFPHFAFSQGFKNCSKKIIIEYCKRFPKYAHIIHWHKGGIFNAPTFTFLRLYHYSSIL